MATGAVAHRNGVNTSPLSTGGRDTRLQQTQPSQSARVATVTSPQPSFTHSASHWPYSQAPTTFKAPDTVKPQPQRLAAGTATAAAWLQVPARGRTTARQGPAAVDGAASYPTPELSGSRHTQHTPSSAATNNAPPQPAQRQPVTTSAGVALASAPASQFTAPDAATLARRKRNRAKVEAEAARLRAEDEAGSAPPKSGGG